MSLESIKKRSFTNIEKEEFYQTTSVRVGMSNQEQ